MTEEHHDYLEEERVPEHSGTNHAMAIGFYIAALIIIYGVTMVLVGIISPAAPSEGDLGFNVNFWWGRVGPPQSAVTSGKSAGRSPLRSRGRWPFLGAQRRPGVRGRSRPARLRRHPGCLRVAPSYAAR